MRATLHQRKIIFLALSVAQICGTAHAADDKSTIGAAMELFGYSSDPSAASIEYRERAKLVLPPRVGDLPAPTEKDAQIEGWPRDPGGVRKRSSDRYAKVPNAPPPEKKPGLLERIRGPRPEAAPGTDDEPGLLQRMIARRQKSNIVDGRAEPPNAHGSTGWLPSTDNGLKCRGRGWSEKVGLVEPIWTHGQE